MRGKRKIGCCMSQSIKFCRSKGGVSKFPTHLEMGIHIGMNLLFFHIMSMWVNLEDFCWHDALTCTNKIQSYTSKIVVYFVSKSLDSFQDLIWRSKSLWIQISKQYWNVLTRGIKKHNHIIIIFVTMLELSNSFCICPFFPFAIVAIIANKFSTRKLSCYGGSIWQILLVVTTMFGPNQSNVINICHGLRTFGSPWIQMPINICYNAKNGKEPEMILIKSKLKQKQLIICKR